MIQVHNIQAHLLLCGSVPNRPRWSGHSLGTPALDNALPQKHTLIGGFETLVCEKSMILMWLWDYHQSLYWLLLSLSITCFQWFPSSGDNRFFLKTLFIYFERGEGREKEWERNISVWLLLARPLQGTWPTIQACALTGNWTSNPLVHRLALNPLSHTNQGPL